MQDNPLAKTESDGNNPSWRVKTLTNWFSPLNEADPSPSRKYTTTTVPESNFCEDTGDDIEMVGLYVEN